MTIQPSTPDRPVQVQMRAQMDEEEVGNKLNLELTFTSPRAGALALRVAAVASGAVESFELVWWRFRQPDGRLITKCSGDPQAGKVDRFTGDFDRMTVTLSRGTLDDLLGLLTRGAIEGERHTGSIVIRANDESQRILVWTVEVKSHARSFYWGSEALPPPDPKHLRLVLEIVGLGTLDPVAHWELIREAQEIYGEDLVTARREALRALGTILEARLARFGDISDNAKRREEVVHPWSGSAADIVARIEKEWDKPDFSGYLDCPAETSVLTRGLIHIQEWNGEGREAGLQALARILAERGATWT